MELNTKLLFAAPILLLIIGAASTNAYAWDGGYGPGGCGWGNCGNYGGQPVCGFCAGEQDAQYDIQNNLQYQPYGSCLPCHSQDYWDNFHQGYDQYWNSHQEQNQGSSINIYGNNNYVSTAQYSNQGQQQNPLQQLTHTICGFVNCDGPQPQEGGYEP